MKFHTARSTTILGLFLMHVPYTDASTIPPTETAIITTDAQFSGPGLLELADAIGKPEFSMNQGQFTVSCNMTEFHIGQYCSESISSPSILGSMHVANHSHIKLVASVS